MFQLESLLLLFCGIVFAFLHGESILSSLFARVAYYILWKKKKTIEFLNSEVQCGFVHIAERYIYGRKWKALICIISQLTYILVIYISEINRSKLIQVIFFCGFLFTQFIFLIKLRRFFFFRFHSSQNDIIFDNIDSMLVYELKYYYSNELIKRKHEKTPISFLYLFLFDL